MNRFFTLAMGVILFTSASMAQSAESTSDKSTKTVTIKDSAVIKSSAKAAPLKSENNVVTDTTLKNASKTKSTLAASSDTAKSAAKDTLKNISLKDSSGVRNDTAPAVKNTADSVQIASLKNDSTVTYSITIKTEPDSVAIVMNDSLKGLSPLMLTGLKAGEYSFILKKKGYYQKKITTVIDSQSVKELTVTLQQPGNVVINSDPAGAAVTFNGEAKGAAPVTISTLKPGEYVLLLTKEAYEPFEKKITITSGKTDTLNCKMVLDTAVINAEQRAHAKQKRDKTKTTSLILGIAFVVFAGIITIIDFSGNK